MRFEFTVALMSVYKHTLLQQIAGAMWLKQKNEKEDFEKEGLNRLRVHLFSNASSLHKSKNRVVTTNSWWLAIGPL